MGALVPYTGHGDTLKGKTKAEKHLERVLGEIEKIKAQKLQKIET